MKDITKICSITNKDSTAIKKYFSDLSKLKAIPREQEQELFKKYLAGDKSAGEEIILHNLRFVITVAKQYQGQGLSLDDLISEGNIGLLKSLQFYDPSKNIKFISYAVWWIRESILQAIYNLGRTIRYPIVYSTFLTKVNKVIADFKIKNNRSPSNEEIAKILNVPEEKVSSTLVYVNSSTSADELLGDEENAFTVGDTLTDNSKADDHLIAESFSKDLESLLSNLTDREHDILCMSFGLNMQELPLKDIGERFGIAGERVRQIREKALYKLRTYYSDELRLLFDQADIY